MAADPDTAHVNTVGEPDEGNLMSGSMRGGLSGLRHALRHATLSTNKAT